MFMSNKAQYLIEGITQDVLTYIMDDYDCNLPTALNMFHNSETFDKLSDEDTGLYIESSAYVYEIFKDEMKFGKIG